MCHCKLEVFFRIALMELVPPVRRAAWQLAAVMNIYSGQ